jgi:hypothetical protein
MGESVVVSLATLLDDMPGSVSATVQARSRTHPV